MNRATTSGRLFVVVGLVSGLVAALGFASEIGPVNAGHPELAAGITLAVSFGFVVIGWGLLRARPWVVRVPSLILGTVGIIAAIGGPIVFRPWAYRGLAGGLSTLITGGLVVCGLGVILSGVYWYAHRAYRQPLAVLAGILAVGLFYIAHQVLDVAIGIPLLAIAVAATFAVAAIAVFAWFDTPTASQSASPSE